VAPDAQPVAPVLRLQPLPRSDRNPPTPPALLGQLSALVGCLDLVAVDVPQRHLRDLAWKVSLLGRPGAEGAPEAVDGTGLGQVLPEILRDRRPKRFPNRTYRPGQGAPVEVSVVSAWPRPPRPQSASAALGSLVRGFGTPRARCLLRGFGRASTIPSGNKAGSGVCHPEPSMLLESKTIDTATRVMAQSYGIRMIVGERDHDWILQDRKPLLFGTREEAEEIDGKPFCAMVLTMDNALALSMWLVAHVVDERRRRQAESRRSFRHSPKAWSLAASHRRAFAGPGSLPGGYANQLRLWFASFAYVLLDALRRIGLRHTQFAAATCGTIRLKLLKIGAQVRLSVRRIKIAMASACPYQTEYHLAYPYLKRAAAF
jgi:Transposase DDE domain group 1